MTNLLRLVLRNILRERLRFLLLVASLAVGFGGFTIISLVLNKELGYDRFHADYQSIYRVITKTASDNGDAQIPRADGALKEYLEKSIPSVQSVTHFIPVYYGVKVKSDNEYFVEKGGLYVDNSFNKVFDFKTISGSRNTMFSQVNSIALTKDFALKYFGDTDVLGKELAIDDGWGLRNVVVTGIYEPVPDNSSLKFDFLLTGRSYGNWGLLLERKALSFFTYLRFKSESGRSDRDFVESSLNDRLTALNNLNRNARSQYLQAIQEIHLSTDISADLPGKMEPNQVYVLWFIALSIIIITSINFINTNAILAASKIKFLGLLKILGHANPFSSVLVLDSIIKCLAALSVVLVLLITTGRAIFAEMFGYRLYLPLYMVLVLVMICLVIGFAGGLIPAKFLSGRRLADLIKGRRLMAMGRYSRLKSASLTIQLFVVTVLMIITSVVISQIDYTDSLDVGYKKSGRMLIPAPVGIGGNYLSFINGARDLHYTRWVGVSMNPFYSQYREAAMKIDQTEYSVQFNMINKDYLSSMGIEITEGNNFTGNYSSDTISAIINETAARQFGRHGEPVLNAIITAHLPLYRNHEFRVIGIMKDFHFESLKSKIEPLVFFSFPFDDFVGDVTIAFEKGQLDNLRKDLPALWKQSGIETPFGFELLEDAFVETHKDENLLGRISKSFTLLAFFLALFGLFAYLRQSTELKNKEFAIRRVLGATALNIYYNLNREMLIFFVVSTIIAVPIGYYSAARWLSQFAYHTGIHTGNFLIPISLALAVMMFIGLYILRDILSRKAAEILKSE